MAANAALDIQARVAALEAQCAADRAELERESVNSQKLMMMCTKINQKLNLILDIAKSAQTKEPAAAAERAEPEGAALMSGFLLQGAPKEKSWKKRWFVLKDGTLSYFASRDASVAKGSISLATCIIEGLTVRDGSAQPSMGLTVDGRQMLLQAETKKEGVAWYLAINCMQQQLDYSRKVAAEGQQPDPRVLAFFKQPFRKTLALDDHPLSLDATTAMESTIRFHSALHTVSFSRAGLGDTHIETLARALAGNKFLRRVALEGNGITSVGSELLAQALAKNESIVELRLAGNLCGDDGAVALAGSLASHPGLSVLDLTANSIGDAGLGALLTALGATPTGLKTLQLSRNNVTDAGAGMAARFVSAHPDALVSIFLDANRVGDEGIVALLEALPASRLQELFAGLNLYNAGSSTLRRLVADAITRTPSLRHVDLSPLVLDEPAISALRLLHTLDAAGSASSAAV